MLTTINNLKIAAVAAAVPKECVDLQSYGARFGEAEVARIIKSSGISRVRVDPNLRASDLCSAAARQLFRATKVVPESIDAIIFVSQTPDRVMPATSATLQHSLGLNTSSAAFDLSYGCSGYIYGLLQASMLISAGCKRVLICSGDTTSTLLGPNDRTVRLLFGDGGSATLVEAGEQSATFAVHTDGKGANALIVPRPDEVELSQNLGVEPGFLHMAGAEVMAFALREVPAVLAEVLQSAGWSEQEVGLFGLHQANSFILHYLRRKLRLDLHRLPSDVADLGNTGPASIPLLLSRVGSAYRSEELRRSVLCGFGVGLSWGAAAVNLASTHFVPMVEI